jgi:hypothetical protein
MTANILGITITTNKRASYSETTNVYKSSSVTILENSLQDKYTLTSQELKDKLEELYKKTPAVNIDVITLVGCTKLSDLSEITFPNTLKILDLEGCTNLNNFSKVKLPESLEVLNLGCCDLCGTLSGLKLPKSLKELHLHQNWRLTDISELELPKSLQYLGLSGCIMLKQLPKDIRLLPNLICLSLSDKGVLIKNLNTETCIATTREEVQNLLDIVYKKPEIRKEKHCIREENGKWYLKFIKVLTINEPSVVTCEEINNKLRKLDENHENIEGLVISGLINTNDTSIVQFPETLKVLRLLCIDQMELKLPETIQELDVEFFSQIFELKLPKSLLKLRLSSSPSNNNEGTILSKLQFPESLQELDLKDCTNISALSALQLPSNLKILNVKNSPLFFISQSPKLSSTFQCGQLESLSNLKLPESLLRLKISIPQLSDISCLKLPDSLQELDLSYLTELNNIDNLKISNRLKKLSLQGCSKLKDLSYLKLPDSLQEVNLAGCINLEKLPYKLKELKNLTALYLSETKATEHIDQYGCNATTSEEVEDLLDIIYNPQEITKGFSEHTIPFFFESLFDNKRESFENGIESLPSKTNVVTTFTPTKEKKDKFTSQELDQQLRTLEKNGENIDVLNFSFCQNITSLSKMQLPKSLKELYLENCANLKDISGLTLPKTLQILDLSNCKNLVNLPNNIRELPNLEKLFLYGTQVVPYFISMKTQEAENRETVLNLLSIIYDKSDVINDYKYMLDEDGNLTSRFVKIFKPIDRYNITIDNLKEKFKKLEVEKVNNIEIVDLSWCDQLVNLSRLKLPSTIQELDLSYCKNLTSILELELPKSLKILNLSDCERLGDLDKIKLPDSLLELNLNYNSQIRSLSQLKLPKLLRKLKLWGCNNLETLPENLKGLPNFEKLFISSSMKSNENLNNQIKNEKIPLDIDFLPVNHSGGWLDYLPCP